MRAKYLRDPIYGFIVIDEEFIPIVDSKIIQRLRNIKQTGFSYYLYPGMVHTRFEHSLGVMHLMGLCLDYIIRNTKKYLGLDIKKEIEEKYKVMKLAALLHDIGHMPFSHDFDAFFKDPRKHEEYCIALLKGSEIGDYINDKLGYFDEVMNILKGREGGRKDLSIFPLIDSLLDSPLDVDKMDYLQRDSFYAGVKYGSYDLMRLLTVIVAYEERGEAYEDQEKEPIKQKKSLNLGILKKGLPAAEQLVLARNSMWMQVYMHRVRTAYTAMFSSLLLSLKEKGEIQLPSIEEIEEKGEEALVSIGGKEIPFSEFDDISMMEYITSLSKNNEEEFSKIRDLVEGIKWRRHYKEAYTTTTEEAKIKIMKMLPERISRHLHNFLPSISSNLGEKLLLGIEEVVKRKMPNLLEEFANRMLRVYKEKRDRIEVFQKAIYFFSEHRPYTPYITSIPTLEMEEGITNLEIMIYNKDERTAYPLSRISSLIGSISYPQIIFRLYAKRKNHRSAIKKEMEKFEKDEINEILDSSILELFGDFLSGLSSLLKIYGSV